MTIDHADNSVAAGGLFARASTQSKREFRIVLVAGLIIWIAIATVLALVARKEWDDMVSGVQSNAATVSRLLADQSDQLLLSADLARDYAARVVGATGPFTVDRAAHNDLRRLIDRSPSIVSIWVGDRDGTAVLTTREFPAPGLSASSREYYTSVRDDPDRLFVGNLLDNQYPAEALLINTSRRLSDPDGNMRGFVQVSLDPATISKTFQQVEIGFDASLWWIGPDGRALIREPALPPEELDGRMPPGSDGWPKNWPDDRAYQTQKVQGSVRDRSGVDGKERLFFWSDAPLYGSRIIVGVSHDAMVAHWMGQMAPIAAFALAIGIASIVILWLLYRSRTRNKAYAAMLENDVRKRTHELALAVEQKDVTMQELSHRVRNAFATILALTRLMLRSSDTLEEFRKDFPARLEALARTHLVLVDSKVRNRAEIADMARAALAPYQDDNNKITIAGPPIELTSDCTLGVGLVLHELVTNAVKYGSLSSTQGSVSVQWHVDGDGIHLVWRESGGPMVEKPDGPGSGTMIINRAAAMFGGEFTREYDVDGVRAEVLIPLSS